MSLPSIWALSNSLGQVPYSLMGTYPCSDWIRGERVVAGKPAAQLCLCRCVSSGTVWEASWLSMPSATVRGPQGTVLAAAAGREASAVPRCGQAGGWERACPWVSLIGAEEQVAPPGNAVLGFHVGIVVSIIQRVVWK